MNHQRRGAITSQPKNARQNHRFVRPHRPPPNPIQRQQPLASNPIQHQQPLASNPIQRQQPLASNPIQRQQPTRNPTLDHRLSQYKIRRIQVPGDGNCQFHSLAYFVHGGDHTTMRTLICDYIEKHQDQFQQDILHSGYPSVQNYVQHMRQSGTWGDAITLQAFGLLFDIDVVLFLPDGVTQLLPDRSTHIALVRSGQHYEPAAP